MLLRECEVKQYHFAVAFTLGVCRCGGELAAKPLSGNILRSISEIMCKIWANEIRCSAKEEMMTNNGWMKETFIRIAQLPLEIQLSPNAPTLFTCHGTLVIILSDHPNCRQNLFENPISCTPNKSNQSNLNPISSTFAHPFPLCAVEIATQDKQQLPRQNSNIKVNVYFSHTESAVAAVSCAEWRIRGFLSTRAVVESLQHRRYCEHRKRIHGVNG